MSMRSQWKGKHPEDNQQRTQPRRDILGENSSRTSINENQSTISHSATLISHPDCSTNTPNENHPKNAAKGSLTCNNDDTPLDTPSRMTRPGDESSERRASATSSNPPQSRRCGSTMIKNVYRQKILPWIAAELENTGSTARDHLANERTWLAYVRTSLAIAGTGVAFVQLFTISINQEGPKQSSGALQRAARPLGATTVMTGVFVLCVGIFRYFLVQTSLTRNQFPVARTTVIAISVIIAALAAVLFGLLIGLKD